MTFILDDLIDLSGLLIVGQPWTKFMGDIRDTAYREMYDIDEINNRLRTNRMLYEYEELSNEEYEKENARLMDLRRRAMQVRGFDTD